MHSFKLLNAVYQSLYAFYVHSVVAAGTESAYETVTLDADHTLGGSELEELVEEVFVTLLEYEADIHTAAIIFLLDGSGEDLADRKSVV